MAEKAVFYLARPPASHLDSGPAGKNHNKEPSVNKNDLIQKLADTTGLAKNDAAKAVEGTFDIIAATLKGSLSLS